MELTRKPTSHIAPFGLRMQEDLRSQLEEAAVQSGRSLNAEIVHRLQESFSGSSNDNRGARPIVFVVDFLCDENTRMREVSEMLRIIHPAIPDEYPMVFGATIAGSADDSLIDVGLDEYGFKTLDEVRQNASVTLTPKRLKQA